MTNPLGLLALLGIPVIIIIYIIKSQYTEQTVNSTYIWTLSEKFLKRRNPLSGLTGIIALILQLLMIVAIAFAIAQPKIPVNTVSRYCFVVDASASMNMSDGSSTRFEKGKAEIREIIEDSPNGSKYSIIYVTDEATMVLEECEDKELALSQLDTLKPSYVEGTDARDLVQEYFDDCKSGKAGQDSDDKSTPIVYLVTDKQYSESNNVNIIDVTNNENNYSISDFTCSLNGNKLEVVGYLNSFLSDEKLTLKIYQEVGNESILLLEKEYDAPKYNFEESIGFKFEETIEVEELSYSSIKAVIDNKDAYALDNEQIIYNPKNEQQYSTLIVTETPFFLRAAIDSHGDYSVTCVTPLDYERGYMDDSYGLYIFDSYTPSRLPEGGTVWMINSDKSLENSGFSYRSGVTLKNPGILEKSKSSNSFIKLMLGGTSNNEKEDEVYIINYQRYSTYTSYTTLYSYEGVPMIMVGENSYGNRMVVFAFSLHDSNIALTGGYVSLIGNLLDYSFPDVLNDTSYESGKTAIVNTVGKPESIKVISPLGNEKYLDTTGTQNEVRLDEVGTYTIEVDDGKETAYHKLYVSNPKKESVPREENCTFNIEGDAVESTRKGIYNPLLIIFIAIAIIFAADWMVFMYEKRQLR